MGYGDKLMAVGDAWAQHQSDPLKRKVAIGNGGSLDLTDSDLTWGLDHFLVTAGTFDPDNQSWVISYPGNRPYIDYQAMRSTLARQGVEVEKRRKLAHRLGRYIWDLSYRAKPAPITLMPHEQALVESWRERGPFVAIEPFIKPNAPPSKQWPVERFVKAARLIARDIPVYQIAAPHRPALPGLPQIVTGSFREAVAVLKAASLYIGPEGGLHHASAAMGTKAVVIFGGFISPQVTGYDFHVNLTGGAEYACGTRHGQCDHCRRAMDEITPEQVAHEARGLLARV